jgi:hypothetical protein
MAKRFTRSLIVLGLIPVYTRFERRRTSSEADRAYFAEVFVISMKTSSAWVARRWSESSAQFGLGWSTIAGMYITKRERLDFGDSRLGPLRFTSLVAAWAGN